MYGRKLNGHEIYCSLDRDLCAIETNDSSRKENCSVDAILKNIKVYTLEVTNLWIVTKKEDRRVDINIYTSLLIVQCI